MIFMCMNESFSPNLHTASCYSTDAAGLRYQHGAWYIIVDITMSWKRSRMQGQWMVWRQCLDTTHQKETDCDTSLKSAAFLWQKRWLFFTRDKTNTAYRTESLQEIVKSHSTLSKWYVLNMVVMSSFASKEKRHDWSLSPRLISIS